MPAVPQLFYKTRLDFQTSISCISFCFVLCNEPKFWQLMLVFSAFYRLYLEITLQYLHQIQCLDKFSCVMWQRLNVSIFWLIASRHYWSSISPSFRNFPFNTLQSGKICWCEVSWYKSKHSRKMHWKFLTWWIKYLTSQEVGWWHL